MTGLRCCTSVLLNSANRDVVAGRGPGEVQGEGAGGMVGMGRRGLQNEGVVTSVSNKLF